MQVKKIKSFFKLFIKQKIEFRFVLFSIGQTLVELGPYSQMGSCEQD